MQFLINSSKGKYGYQLPPEVFFDLPMTNHFVSQLSPSAHLFSTTTVFNNYSTLNNRVFERWDLVVFGFFSPFLGL